MIPKLFRRRAPPPAPQSPGPAGDREAQREELLQHPQLWWLTDVPMFLDDHYVDRLHGAVVRPEYVLLQSQETAGRSRTDSRTGEMQTGIEASIPTFLKLATSVKYAAGTASAVSAAQQLTKQFVHTAEQRLQDILVEYRRTMPARVLFADATADGLSSYTGERLTWEEAEALTDRPGPRPMLFFDLPPGSAILPMAGETVEGTTVLLYTSLIERLEQAGCVIPRFPLDSDPDAPLKKDAHWDALIAGYRNSIAMEVIEKGFSQGHRIEWIDYRLKLPSRRKPAHVHFSPRGQVATGAFAYNFVRRGFKVGLRVIAQLKRGGDMNALALYER
jgi:hypothetical protein